MKKIKQILKKIFNKYTKLKKQFSNIYYISIGENCLTDNILERHNLKSFSTPYSHGRSNIDYAITLEKNNYYNLLESKYLFYDYFGSTKVVRNNYYSKSENIFHEFQQNGFEFTHHDVINNKSHIKSYHRKVLRMKSFKKNNKIKFLYHYRSNKYRDLKLIIIKGQEFLSYYQKRNIKCEFIFFSQNIISNKEERKLLKIHDSNNIKGYILNTLEVWTGDDLDVFWARKDDDLFSLMIKEIK